MTKQPSKDLIDKFYKEAVRREASKKAGKKNKKAHMGAKRLQKVGS